jgi:hypothetical protein
VTTAGGPEHSVAEPATIDSELDGDDIVVVPDAPPSRHRRSRALLVGAVVVALIATGIGIAVAVTRDDGNGSVSTSAPARTTPTPVASQPERPEPTQPTKKPVAEQPPASVAPETPVSSPPVVIVPPPPPVVPQEPPDPLPPTSPPSVLQWSATPAALTIPAGGHKTLTVHVVNPSDGTVTLGNPLSCAPTLHGPKGKVIGYAVCVEMAQLIAPHDELNQRYVIYATDSAAAGGEPLPEGIYTASIQDLFDVKVTVTA